MYIEQFFHLKENRTAVRTEVIMDITTFMTMVYILAVNPNLLGKIGMDGGSIFTATALASAITSFAMALLVDLSFVLSAGTGLNAYFTYTVCMDIGYSWEVALAAACVEGLIFIVLSPTNVHEAIFNATPDELKLTVSVGIGLFITLIGLQNARIVVDSATLVALFSFKGSVTSGTFSSEDIIVLLALIGMLITALLVIKNVKDNILLGILITWGLGILCRLFGLYIPDPDTGFHSLTPFSLIAMPALVTPTLFKMDFSDLLSLNFVVVVFSFLSVDIFNTLGTLTDCASKADMLDKDDKLPRIKGILLADAIGTMIGAVLGTSTITTSAGSSSGIAEGGRTGLTSIVVGFPFLLSLFFSPIFLAIPSFATAPALIIVGFFMMQQVSKIDRGNILTTTPSFICIFTMPFTYSISEGIAFDIISYTVLYPTAGKGKNVTVLMHVLSFIFILKYTFLQDRRYLSHSRRKGLITAPAILISIGVAGAIFSLI